MRCRHRSHGATKCVLAGLVLMLSLDVVTAAQGGHPPSDTVALQAFHDEIDKYLAMLRKLREELPVLVPNSSAREISATSDVLAAAIQRAKPNARIGDFFKGESGRVITRRVVDVVRTANLGPVLAAIDDEPPTIKAPGIHVRFPAASQMATMPPSILEVLPRLPAELEYRIIGNNLILRDINAALILDYIPGAVPRR